MTDLFQKEKISLHKWNSLPICGKVIKVNGLIIESLGPQVAIGDLCYIPFKKQKIFCEVVSFSNNHIFLMSFDNTTGLSPGVLVYPLKKPPSLFLGPSLLGRVLDAFGNPIDNKGPLIEGNVCILKQNSPSPLERRSISSLFSTGIKTIDSLFTLGKGQRIGIFSEPGCGKSSLLAMFSRFSSLDVNVISLIGERSREIKDFIDNEISEEQLQKSVIVVSKSDDSPLLKIHATKVAMAIAEYFRDTDLNVLLTMDSLSKYAFALRELASSLKEPVISKGYSPSIFSALAQLLERCGTAKKGSITGVFAILCEDEELCDPLTHHIKALLDGHIFLSKEKLEEMFFPCIDVFKSLSRVMSQVADPSHVKAATKIKQLLKVYYSSLDMILLGTYEPNTNLLLDEAIKKIPDILSFLSQQSREFHPFSYTLSKLKELSNL